MPTTGKSVGVTIFLRRSLSTAKASSSTNTYRSAFMANRFAVRKEAVAELEELGLMAEIKTTNMALSLPGGAHRNRAVPVRSMVSLDERTGIACHQSDRRRARTVRSGRYAALCWPPDWMKNLRDWCISHLTPFVSHPEPRSRPFIRPLRGRRRRRRWVAWAP